MKYSMIIGGNSHVAAFGVPLALPDQTNVLMDALHSPNTIKVLTGEWPRSEKYWSDLVQVARGEHVALFWNGNQHLAKFLFQLSEPFDFVVPGKDFPLEARATIVPQAAIRELLSKGFDHLSSVIERLHSVHCRVIVCAPPPPKGDDLFIRQVLTKEKYFSDYAAARKISLDVIQLTPRYIRLKLWSVLCSIFAEIAQKHSVPFLVPPSHTMDDDGFLKRKYYAEDVTHANIEYGLDFSQCLVDSFNNLTFIR